MNKSTNNKSIYFGGTFAGNNMKALEKKRFSILERLLSLGFYVYDPLRNRAIYDISALEMSQKFTPNEIVDRDLDDIRRSDILLICMTMPSIGSSCEMMFAKLRGKMIVIVSDNPSVTQHPWVKAFATKIFESIDDVYPYLTTFLS